MQKRIARQGIRHFRMPCVMARCKFPISLATRHAQPREIFALSLQPVGTAGYTTTTTAKEKRTTSANKGPVSRGKKKEGTPPPTHTHTQHRESSSVSLTLFATA
ncbi:hypothetical protein ACJQWK_01437 [Exserohilum turcicum]